MRTPFLASLAAGLVLVFATACGGSGGTTTPAPGSSKAPSAAPVASANACLPGGAGTPVAIANFKFDPAALTVTAGTTVTWANADSATHTVTFDNGPDCGNLSPGVLTSLKFDTPGTFAYHCRIHSTMTGTVTVQ